VERPRGPDPGSRASRTGALASLGAYLVVFFLLALPWLRAATHAIPAGGAAVGWSDAQLAAWVLAWTAHALVTQPAHLFDANIHHPAPHQLTGSEYFASSQLVFAPLFWLTHNAVLAASLGALLSYPLGALAMDRLLRAFGCSALAAWTGGLVFALGPLRAPGNLQLYQYPNLYFPLVTLALTRLRQEPRAGRALVLGAVFALGLLSAYYMAVMLCVTAALWAVLEAWHGGAGRGRFALLGAAAGAAALLVLVAASGPYLARWEDPWAGRQPEAAGDFGRFMYLESLRWFGTLPLALAGLGLLALGAPSPGASTLAWRGLLVTAVAALLMLGPAQKIAGHVVPFPFVLLLASPARFFRLPWRFVVMEGFGAALLAGAALAAIATRLGRRGGALAITAVAASLVATRGVRLAGSGLQEIPGQSLPIYDAVRAAASREGPGPLLELPLIGAEGRPTEPDSMVGSTRHWLPLLGGYTGYQPPHHALLQQLLSRLPPRQAVADLVDMTHLRWLLLHPAAEWRVPKANVRTALLGLPELRHVVTQDGWELLSVGRQPQHPEWFAALAAGPRAGQTLLGTPLVHLASAGAVARVSAPKAPAQALAGPPLSLALQITNAGAAPWPVTVPPRAPLTYTVRMIARWWPPLVPHEDGTTVVWQDVELPRDVPAGEELPWTVWLQTPFAPGPYDVEVGVRQVDGARFDGPGNEPLRLRLEMTARPAAG